MDDNAYAVELSGWLATCEGAYPFARDRLPSCVLQDRINLLTRDEATLIDQEVKTYGPGLSALRDLRDLYRKGIQRG